MTRRKPIAPLAPGTHEVPNQCVATNKRTGYRCQRRAIRGTTVCQVHGGIAARGNTGPLAVQATAGGKYSKVLGGSLLQHYEDARRDGELLELAGEIELVEGLLRDALASADAGHNISLWRQVRGELTRFSAAMAQQDARTMSQSFAKLQELVGDGTNAAVNMENVVRLIDAKKKLKESERKRYIEMRAIVTADELKVLVGRFTAVLRKHIDDDALLARIGMDMLEAMKEYRG